jgi:ribosomal protein S18 acetylase RimI-like enzyme
MSAMTAIELPIRQAKLDDIPSMQRIVAAAYDTYLSRMDKPPAPMSRDLTPAVQIHQAWVVGDPIVGLGILVPLENALQIENVAVDPTAQGRGVGRQLLTFAEQHARALGKEKLQLYTNEKMVENVAIYTRLGYLETDRRTEDGYSRIFMEKALPTR